MHAASAAALVAVVTIRGVLVILGGGSDGRVSGGSGLPVVLVCLALNEFEVHIFEVIFRVKGGGMAIEYIFDLSLGTKWPETWPELS